MSETNPNQMAKGIRQAARVIGLCAAGFFLAMLVGEAISEALTTGLQPVTVEVIPPVVLGGIVLAGCIVSWRRERLAGILLIAAAIGFGIAMEVAAECNHVQGWSMLRLLLGWSYVGLPLLIAGVLFLISSWLSRKANS